MQPTAGVEAFGYSVAYLRFVTSERDPDSGVEAGVFGLKYKLRDAPSVAVEDREFLRDVLTWFENHLTKPDRFNRSGSKGYYRRNTKGIAWFRDSASECLSRMHHLKRILETYGHPVEVVREERIGYIVYEDALQVVAEPFSDTRTGA